MKKVRPNDRASKFLNPVKKDRKSKNAKKRLKKLRKKL